jgi:hypothetical protein
MGHPLQDKVTGRVFFPLLVATLVVMAVMNVTGKPLITEAAPQGIISFELAGDVPTAQAILDSWDAPSRVYAGFSLGFDFLFMPLYSTTIGLGCLWAAQVWRRSRLLAGAGGYLAWGQWLAASLDVVENVALWHSLVGGPAAPWPRLAWVCAEVKFALVLLGLAYAASGVVRKLWPR